MGEGRDTAGGSGGGGGGRLKGESRTLSNHRFPHLLS